MIVLTRRTNRAATGDRVEAAAVEADTEAAETHLAFDGPFASLDDGDASTDGRWSA